MQQLFHLDIFRNIAITAHAMIMADILNQKQALCPFASQQMLQREQNIYSYFQHHNQHRHGIDV